MKLFRFAFFFFILALAGVLAHAKAPWGILTETVDDTTFSIYAIDNLIDKRPIRYAVSARVTPQEEQIFKENILKWPAETLRIVRESGRPEFNDITRILERKLVLERVSVSDTPDIYLEITENVDCGGESADGCFKKKGDLPYSVISLGPSVTPFFRDVSLHEIGHYFGLGDQYDRTRANSHPEYSSDVNKEEGAVMRDPYITNGKITCDDADGFINLLDLRLAQRPNGRFPDRAQKGWRGLCPSIQNNYEKSKTTNRQAVDSWEGIDFTLRTYK